MLRLVASCVSAVSAYGSFIQQKTQTQTLVLLDSWATIETHSYMMSYLQEKLNHQLTFEMADAKIKLKEHDNWTFDNIILMAPSVKENVVDQSISVDNLVAFFKEEQHNLIAFGDVDSRRHIRNLALQFGVDFEPFHSELVDVEQRLFHGGKPMLTSSNIFKPLTTLHTPVFTADSKVAYQGIGQTIDKKNEFVFPILSGEVSTQSVGDSDGQSGNSMSGEQLTLVSGYQSRNNHRAIFSGSMAMCSDEYLVSFKSNNKIFCEQLLDWVMQESGVLRVTNIRHQKEGTVTAAGALNPENYFIEDKIEYFVQIDQKTKGKWTPHHSDDIQLEFVMLEPYIRTGLKGVNGVYQAKFRTPQRLGIFKFSVEHSRHGLSHLHLDDEVSIIQWRHDAFPRFMHRAAPFYISVFVLMAGFFVFIVSFLFAGDLHGHVQVKKTN